MKRYFVLLLLVAAALPRTAQSVTHYRTNDYTNTGVTLRLADGSGAVYKEGETVTFSVRTDSDAYVVVFNIDTEGFVHLLYPRAARSLRKLTPDDEIRLPEASDESLLVSGRTGMEFVFAIAAKERDAVDEREIGFLLDGEKLAAEEKFRIDGDPFLAANRIARRLIRGISTSGDVSIAYTYFFINKAVDYPRYLCEDCYDTGKDPYRASEIEYVATAAFDDEDRLSYPLKAAFEVSSGYAAEGSGQDEENVDRGAGAARVYVTYYPWWDHGFYYRPWWIGYSYWSYADPFYYHHYYPYRWSFSFGFGHHGYSPYYYPYYFGYGGHHHRYYDHNYFSLAYTGFRHDGRFRYKAKSSLYTAMTYPAAKYAKVRSTRYKSRVAQKSSTAKVSKKIYRGKTRARPVYKVSSRNGSGRNPGKRVIRRGHRITRKFSSRVEPDRVTKRTHHGRRVTRSKRSTISRSTKSRTIRGPSRKFTSGRSKAGSRGKTYRPRGSSSKSRSSAGKSHAPSRGSTKRSSRSQRK